MSERQPVPCRACDGTMTHYWVCLACNARWAALKHVSVVDFINAERRARGLPPKGSHWDGTSGAVR